MTPVTCQSGSVTASILQGMGTPESPGDGPYVPQSGESATRTQAAFFLKAIYFIYF